MVFSVLGAVAESERSLIGERVKAGIRKARANAKRLRRPRKVADRGEIHRLRFEGISWRVIGKALGVSPATALHTARKHRFRNPPETGHAK